MDVVVSILLLAGIAVFIGCALDAGRLPKKDRAPRAKGPVAVWDGAPRRMSSDHDSVHDEP